MSGTAVPAGVAPSGRPSRVEPVTLDTLAGLARADGVPGPAVTGVTHDSRRVEPGDLYAALPGARAHGADFTEQARRRGALALLTDAEGAARAGGRLPALVVDAPRAVLGAVASRVYGEPSSRLAVYGVTGTNGKTTTAYLLEAGLRGAGRSTGLIGTIETRVAGERLGAERTTPEAPDLQALLALMVERGVSAVAMEVSSHALALGRVDGVRFLAGLFTNLSQDHLDFHPSMEDYFAAKAALFDPARCGVGVICTDDAWGRRLAGESAARGLRTVTVGRSGAWRIGGTGPMFELGTPAGAVLEAGTRLVGGFNVANAALALAALAETGIDVPAAVRGVAELPGVPGRVERVDAGQPFLAVVDYAHTPDAVAALLRTLRPLTAGRLVAVLGCGGDRDRAKRPLMGEAVARYADVAVLTDDNPRSESSASIITAMRSGALAVPVADRAEMLVEPDRARAIALAVELAGKRDTVVVAGKGHETGQEAGGTVTPFDDLEVLRAAIGRQVPAGSRA